MHIRKLVFVVIMLIMLVGCSDDGIRIHNETKEDATKAEELLMEDKDLTAVVTVFHDKDLLASVTLKTFSRFNKEKIEKNLQEKLEELYPDFDVTVSADRKMWMETNKLINSTQAEKMAEKIEKLKLLLKEET